MRREEEKARFEEQKKEGKLPFWAYLVISGLMAILGVASLFEYSYKNPIFGVIQQSNFFYTPILGTFVVVSLPLSIYCFYLGVTAANELAESMDRIDKL